MLCNLVIYKHFCEEECTLTCQIHFAGHFGFIICFYQPRCKHMKIYHNIFAIFLTVCFTDKSTFICNQTFIDDFLDFVRIFWSCWNMFQYQIKRNYFSTIYHFFLTRKQACSINGFSKFDTDTTIFEISIFTIFKVLFSVETNIYRFIVGMFYQCNFTVTHFRPSSLYRSAKRCSPDLLAVFKCICIFFHITQCYERRPPVR